jgi:hypothetical protein
MTLAIDFAHRAHPNEVKKGVVPVANIWWPELRAK